MAIVYTKERDWYLLGSKLQVKAMSSAIEVDVLDSSVQQSIPKDWPPIIFMAYEEPLPVISVDNKIGFDSSDQCADGWLSRIREELYSIPSVEDIFVSIEDSDVDVWVVIPERDLAVLHQLASIEWKMLKIFVSGAHPPFLIDFHVIYRCGRNADDLVPTRTIRLPRQVE